MFVFRYLQISKKIWFVWYSHWNFLVHLMNFETMDNNRDYNRFVQLTVDNILDWTFVGRSKSVHYFDPNILSSMMSAWFWSNCFAFYNDHFWYHYCHHYYHHMSVFSLKWIYMRYAPGFVAFFALKITFFLYSMQIISQFNTHTHAHNINDNI